MLADCFNDEVVVNNRAIGGRGTKRFENEERLEKIFDSIKPGDFIFIQFGIYESDKNNEQWNASVEDYKDCIKTKYLDEASKRGAVPVLLTPCAQALWDEKAVGGDGKFVPDAAVTRAEFLKMAMDAAEISAHGYRAGECLDALKSDWYCHYLQGALDRGMIPLEMTKNSVEPAVKVVAEATEKKKAETVNIMSYKCGFRGDMPITQEEMAVIAINCLRSTAARLKKQ